MILLRCSRISATHFLLVMGSWFDWYQKCDKMAHTYNQNGTIVQKNNQVKVYCFTASEFFYT